MATKLFASHSPHIHGGEKTHRIMLDVVLALIPALAVSTYVLGWRVLFITAVAVVSCVAFEWLICRFLLKRRSTICDLSAVVTGVLLAFNLPVGIPWWIVVIGALVAIGIGKMTAGTAYNIVASEAELEGTIRCLTPEVRRQMKEQLENLAKSIAASFGGEASFEWKDFTSPLINDEISTAEAQKVARDLFGEKNVLTAGEPSLGGDDFAEYILAYLSGFCQDFVV